jgi:phage baseplate assembly protein W
MKAFAVRNGDLVMGPTTYDVVSGPAKIAQDLGIACREPIGCDRFHPNWGSLLPTYVGLPAQQVDLMVRGEVSRLIQNYSMVQRGIASADVANRVTPRLSPSEIVGRVDSIQVQQAFDAFSVQITLSTLDHNSKVLLTQVVGVTA